MVITIIIDLIAETFFQGYYYYYYQYKDSRRAIKMNMLH
jgi:hypothetical protein